MSAENSPPQIDKEKIRDKLNFIQENRRRLEELRTGGVERFRHDPFAEAAATRMLQVSIEAMIDVANHIVARLRLGTPKTYREAMDLLVEAGILPAEQQETFRQMVRFRNRAVHLYDTIAPDEVYRILDRHLGDFDVFIAAIVRRFFQ